MKENQPIPALNTYPLTSKEDTTGCHSGDTGAADGKSFKLAADGTFLEKDNDETTEGIAN